MQVFAITLLLESLMQVPNEFGLYIRSVCLKYEGCTGCPLTGGVVTYFGDSEVVCESGRNKGEQRTRENSDGSSKTGDAESTE